MGLEMKISNLKLSSNPIYLHKIFNYTTQVFNLVLESLENFPFVTPDQPTIYSEEVLLYVLK